MILSVTVMSRRGYLIWGRQGFLLPAQHLQGTPHGEVGRGALLTSQLLPLFQAGFFPESISWKRRWGLIQASDICLINLTHLEAVQTQKDWLTRTASSLS